LAENGNRKAGDELCKNSNYMENPPPLSNDSHFNKVMDCIRKFELEQISLFLNFCSICKEQRIGMKIMGTGKQEMNCVKIQITWSKCIFRVNISLV
jgi:hypothetical protein